MFWCSPCMAASSTFQLPPAPLPPPYPPPAPHFIPIHPLRILHLQGGVTLKTLPVLNYPVLLPLLPLLLLRLVFIFSFSYCTFVSANSTNRLWCSATRTQFGSFEIEFPISWAQKIFFQKQKLSRSCEIVTMS